MGASSRESNVDRLIRYVNEYLDNDKIPTRLKNKEWLPKTSTFRQFCREVRERNKNRRISPKDATGLIVTSFHDQNMKSVQEFLKFFGLPVPYNLPDPFDILFSSSVRKTFHVEITSLEVSASFIKSGDEFKVRAVAKGEPLAGLSVLMKEYEKLDEKHDVDVDRRAHLHAELERASYEFILIGKEKVWVKWYRIRLRGVDAPEYGQDHFEGAKQKLVQLIGDKTVTIFVTYIDHRMYYLADVYCDQLSIQEELLKNGDVWQDTRYDQTNLFEKLQNDAREKQVGLWHYENPMEPWEYRRIYKGKRGFEIPDYVVHYK